MFFLLLQNFFNDVFLKLLKNKDFIGGKIIGAGGGGFMVFYVPENKQEKLKKVISNLLYIPIQFENNGSKIIYAKSQKQYKKEENHRLQYKIKSFKELKDLK